MTERGKPKRGRVDSPAAGAGGAVLPLHPGGAVRHMLDVTAPRAAIFDALGSASQQADFGDDRLLLAEELVGLDGYLDGPDRETLGIALLALGLAQRAGATRLSLDPKGSVRKLVEAIMLQGKLQSRLQSMAHAQPGATDAEVQVSGRELTVTVQRIRDLCQPGFGQTIGAPGQRRPLVRDGEFLTTHRLWTLERGLAADLRPRLTPGLRPDATPIDVDGLPAFARLTSEQRGAVHAALAQPLTCIAGGPGTGKTAIVLALVRALEAQGIGPIALAAPTGKAAAHLADIVGGPPGLTLHRLLGWTPTGWRHGRHHPLPYAVVIVDEASMIDLATLRALIAALGPATRLVLLGDPDQLPSVEAGRVFADLDAFGAASDAPWRQRLTHSFRMNPADPAGSAILTLARAVIGGDPTLPKPAKLTAPSRLTLHGVEWFDSANDADVHALVDAWFGRLLNDPQWQRLRAREYRAELGLIVNTGDPDGDSLTDLRALLHLTERRRVLAGVHHGPRGTLALGRRPHVELLRGWGGDGAPEALPGEPIIITRNDRALGLFNGDAGVVARVRDSGGQHFAAVFARGAELRAVRLEAIRDHMALAWATTVHKAQGSEFDQVLLVLPAEASPILTRPLLYTGLTRARASVVIAATQTAWSRAVGSLPPRDSGLPALLRGPA